MRAFRDHEDVTVGVAARGLHLANTMTSPLVALQLQRERPLMNRTVFLGLVSLTACGHADEATHDATNDAVACDRDRLLLTTYQQQRYIRVLANGADAFLMLDTGSNLTFLQEPLGTTPDPTPNAGTIVLGCSSTTLVGRPEAKLPDVNGTPTIGQFGTDRVLAQPTEIDLAGGALSFHMPGVKFDEAMAWPTASFEVVQGLILPQVTLGGSPVRLMLDTGAPDTLWLGQQPQPGDVEADVEDAAGNIVPTYRGTSTLAIGSWNGIVPVTRVPSWPYFEQTVRDLGGDVVGLLGLSSLGRGVVIDEEHVLRANL